MLCARTRPEYALSVSVVTPASNARSADQDVGEPRDPGKTALTPESIAGGGILAETAREVEALEAEQRERESAQERLAHRLTAATGTMTFVVLNLFWFASWIVLNLPGMPTVFDPFPFALLTMLVSLEAIILSVLVLISENAQSRRAERRASIDMHVNVLAEREITRLIELVTDIHKTLGLTPPPPDEREMATPTHLVEVANSLDAVSQAEDKHA